LTVFRVGPFHVRKAQCKVLVAVSGVRMGINLAIRFDCAKVSN
jgi:hypothetical protein